MSVDTPPGSARPPREDWTHLSPPPPSLPLPLPRPRLPPLSSLDLPGASTAARASAPILSAPAASSSSSSAPLPRRLPTPRTRSPPRAPPPLLSFRPVPPAPTASSAPSSAAPLGTEPARARVQAVIYEALRRRWSDSSASELQMLADAAAEALRRKRARAEGLEADQEGGAGAAGRRRRGKRRSEEEERPEAERDRRSSLAAGAEEDAEAASESSGSAGTSGEEDDEYDDELGDLSDETRDRLSPLRSPKRRRRVPSIAPGLPRYALPPSGALSLHRAAILRAARPTRTLSLDETSSARSPLRGPAEAPTAAELSAARAASALPTGVAVPPLKSPSPSPSPDRDSPPTPPTPPPPPATTSTTIAMPPGLMPVPDRRVAFDNLLYSLAAVRNARKALHTSLSASISNPGHAWSPHR
ncbi:hypothetical protein JCM8202_000914 [Rhodotorula sphaerocarpa]